MINTSSQDIKALNKFINEPDDFKRYILINLWVSVFYTNSIISDMVKRINNTSEKLTDSEIYNIINNIKTGLTDENIKLKLTLNNMKNNYDVIKVINNVMNLDLNDDINEINERINKIENVIKNNDKHIESIKTLSENKIAEIRNETIQNH